MIRTLLLSVALISAGIAADDFEQERKERAKKREEGMTVFRTAMSTKQKKAEMHLKEEIIPAIAWNYEGHPESIERLSKSSVVTTYSHINTMQLDLIEDMGNRRKISEKDFNTLRETPPRISINYSWEQGRLKYIGSRPRFEDLDECGHSSK